MKSLLTKLCFLLVLLAISAGQAQAQPGYDPPPPCNTAIQVCATILVPNGIMGNGFESWKTQVATIGTDFLKAHPTLAPDDAPIRVRFEAVYNESNGFWKDIFKQSDYQWTNQDEVDFEADPMAWIEAHKELFVDARRLQAGFWD